MFLEFNAPSMIGGLLFALLFAWVTYTMAKNRGREAALWGVLGFFFPCVAIVVLLLIGDRR